MSGTANLYEIVAIWSPPPPQIHTPTQIHLRNKQINENNSNTPNWIFWGNYNLHYDYIETMDNENKKQKQQIIEEKKTLLFLCFPLHCMLKLEFPNKLCGSFDFRQLFF